AQVGDPGEATVALGGGRMPEGAGGVDVAAVARAVVGGILEQRSGFTLLGALLFTWLATRLVGTLRVALREIFDIGQDRGILLGKLFDVLVVVLGALLLTLILGVTISLQAAIALGVGALGVGGSVVGIAQRLLGQVVALVSVWCLFLVLYRYLPARRVPWRTAGVAATFSAVLHEALKVGFSWYAVQIADYTSTWGNLTTVAVFFFWIYYEAVVFIIGGEVAQVYTLRKAGTVKAGAIPGGAS
ncbi:MAG: YihY/virulence factor BrkB family protein, partial [Gemmatimonadetes bacterium]|nr:YihY/virulence factor BrkB family protein [Gemmatimonadota bacterium]